MKGKSDLMNEYENRTARLIGEDAVERLHAARVAVFGIGGVGSFAAEAIARAGVGSIDLIDADRVSPSNINRQLIALRSTVGEYKVDVMASRIRDIRPETVVRTYPVFYDAETADTFDFSRYDYIVDAIDTVSSKLLMIERAASAGTPLISSMGTGNKLHPERFQIADITKTSVCPLARVMRRELKKRGIEHLKVLFSDEVPLTPAAPAEETAGEVVKRNSPASISFVPSAAGLMIAGEVIRSLASL